ncbi:hypothetical protein [Bradyrhizobium sp. RDT46]|uniref:hypothetical protein n=1 Tax=Bradyrhizobium sp. RDT46 TaxID=3341829 RepID=UPI0035C735C1
MEKRVKTIDTEIKRLTDQIARGISATALGDGIKAREAEKSDLRARLDDIENASVTFELKRLSLADYAVMAERMLANVSANSKSPGNIELSEHLEALVKHVYVHPLKPKGFEVEVFGKLATLVTGSLSYRAQHRKGNADKDMLTSESLTISRAAQKLVIALPRSRGPSHKPPRKAVPRQSEPDLVRVLARSDVPLTARVIARQLGAMNVVRTVTAVHNALARRPGQFIRIRKNGFMLRSKWEKLKCRYLVTTAEIVEATREVLEASGKPMRPQEILEQLRARRRKIFGDELGVLKTVLSKHPDVFEAKGRQYARWILRSASAPVEAIAA